MTRELPEARLTLAGVLAVLLGIALAGGGCAAAGLAATGPLFSAVQLVTDRSIERTLSADLTTAWMATVDSLTRMAIQVRDGGRDGDTRVLEGAGEKVSVRAELSPVTSAMTRLSLRVEAGRLTADKRTAEEIVNQVVSSLASRTGSASPDVSAQLNAQSETLGSLRAEVARLRSRIEEDRTAKHAGPAASASASSAAPVSVVPGIVEIPASYGFPSMPSPPTAGLLRRSDASDDRGPVTTPMVESAALIGAVGPSPLAHSLSPVGVLTPVQSMTAPRSSQ